MWIIAVNQITHYPFQWLINVFCFVTEAAGKPVSDTERDAITWMASVDRKIQSMPSDGKEKKSLKRLKHLHQEKVVTAYLIRDSVNKRNVKMTFPFIVCEYSFLTFR